MRRPAIIAAAQSGESRLNVRPILLYDEPLIRMNA
jgi:hypothetical protein